MPTYRVTAPDGRIVRLTGDSPPTDEELEDIFAKLPAKAGAAEGPGYLRGAESIGPTPWYNRGMLGGGRGPSVRDALTALPAVGGAIGGIAGAPGLVSAVGGAALGGAGGEALKQLGERAIGVKSVPQSGLEAAKNIGIEGGIQGAAELAGAGLARGGKALGRGMVENAVRPPISLQNEFPGVIDTIVKERLPVGAGVPGVGGTGIMAAQKGSEQAKGKLLRESKAVKALLKKATAGGKTFETSKLAEPVLKLIDDVGDQPLAAGDMARVESMLDEFLNKKGPLSPTDVQKLKQKAQAIAKPIYKAQGRGEAVSADQATSARFNAAIASGAKDAMETIPGVAEREARKRELIGAKKALSQAEKRRMSLMAEVGAGVLGSAAGSAMNVPLNDPFSKSIAGWMIARGLLSPRSLSRAGLMLTSEQAAALMRQSPRLGAWLLRSGSAPEGQISPTEPR